ncbi:diacylglycerol acyltransferase-domain-containing protein [Xylariomycetidae sp. FL2044]|nr:diacylglycerol acyltransferase-domain-containing protein [Xylariomycetidae sp. FL2044]
MASEVNPEATKFTSEPKNATSPRYFYLGSRRSSEASTSRPDAKSVAEGARRADADHRYHRRDRSLESSTPRSEKGHKSHRRDTSSVASQEDLPGPRTPPSSTRIFASKGHTPRVVEDDSHKDPFSPESPSSLSKTALDPATVLLSTPESSSRTSRGQLLKSNPTRQVSKRTLKTRESSKMNDSAEDKPAQSVTGSEETAARESAEGRLAPGDSEKNVPHGASYAQVADPQTQHPNGKEATASVPRSLVMPDIEPEEPRSKTQAEKTSREQGQVHNGVSYSDALKSDSDLTGQDDDSSYPDLDDMTMGEVHPPLPAPKPNGGVRWAPWNVPLKRRSQTLVVLMHSLCIGALVSVFFAFCANPLVWPLLLLYLLYALSSKAATDGTLNYRSEWFRKSYIWRLFADYFPARLHKTYDLPPTRKYIFGYHPHGIISHGAWAAFATDALGFSEKFPGITNSLLTLDSNFRIPFYRDYVLAMGVRSVSKESIVNILMKGGLNGEGMGRGVTVVVGGARESLEAEPGTLRLILKERKGFIKLAVRTGADLVPVLAFGENDLYDQLRPKEHPTVHKLQMFILKVWKFTLPFLHGRGIFNYDVGLMPYRRPLNIVVGAPIQVRQAASVDQDEINRLHHLYVAELQKLWDRYKDEFAPDRKAEMQILP